MRSQRAQASHRPFISICIISEESGCTLTIPFHNHTETRARGCARQRVYVCRRARDRMTSER